MAAAHPVREQLLCLMRRDALILTRPCIGTALTVAQTPTQTRLFSTSRASFQKTKKAAQYVCSDCGNESPKWAGQCPACGAWDTLKEFRAAAADKVPSARNVSPAAFRTAAPQVKASAASRAWLLPPSSSKGPDGAAAASDTDAAIRLTPLSRLSTASLQRSSLGSAELDRLLGGGIVPGSVTLLGGAPGAGKSTLLLQICALLCDGQYVGGDSDGSTMPYADFFCSRRSRRRSSQARSASNGAVINGDGGIFAPPRKLVAYISGEESASQLQGRATRLGIDAPGLLVLNETRVDSIIQQLQEAVAAAALSPSDSGGPASLAAVVIDSIQTVFSDSLPGAAGSVTQVRECAVRLTQWAKATGVPVILVGHVTKAGDLAGPRVLEHLVDTVLFMEGEEGSVGGGSGGYSAAYADVSTGGGFGGSNGGARLVRAIKNRFGSTSEVGIFRMSDAGFTESNPARLFLSRPIHSKNSGGSDADDADAEGEEATTAPSGCAVTVTVEGSRPLCVEVQALATARYAAFPRHRAMGVSQDRLFMLAAVLSRHTSLRPRAHEQDLLLNVVGGLRISDPAADLAIAVAIASTLTGRPAPPDVIFLGEVGLGGEIRPSSAGGAFMEKRLRAASALGFRTAFVPVGTKLAPSKVSPARVGADAAQPVGTATGSSGSQASSAAAAAGASPHQLRLVHVRTVAEALQRAFASGSHHMHDERSSRRGKPQHPHNAAAAADSAAVTAHAPEEGL